MTSEKSTLLCITPISKEEMIYYRWYDFDGMEGMSGKFAWAANSKRMLMGANRFAPNSVDDDLKPLHRLISKRHRTLPSCSGHFLDFETLWTGYANFFMLMEKMNPNTVNAKSLRTGKKIPWHFLSEANATSLSDIGFDIVEDSRTGIYGWMLENNYDIIRFNDFARKLRKNMPNAPLECKIVSYGGENAGLIITKPLARNEKSNLWEAIYEVAKSHY